MKNKPAVHGENPDAWQSSNDARRILEERIKDWSGPTPVAGTYEEHLKQLKELGIQPAPNEKDAWKKLLDAQQNQ